MFDTYVTQKLTLIPKCMELSDFVFVTSITYLHEKRAKDFTHKDK